MLCINIHDIMTLPILEFLVTVTAVLTAETGPVDPDVDTIKAAPTMESPATLTDGLMKSVH